MYWKKWWKCAAIRMIKTICQTAVATIGTTALLTDVEWGVVISASLLAGVLSLLTSLAGLPECNDMSCTECVTVSEANEEVEEDVLS